MTHPIALSFNGWLALVPHSNGWAREVAKTTLPPDCPPKVHSTAGGGCSHATAVMLCLVAATKVTAC